MGKVYPMDRMTPPSAFAGWWWGAWPGHPRERAELTPAERSVAKATHNRKGRRRRAADLRRRLAEDP